MDSLNPKDEPKKNLEICKKLFVDGKYADCVKCLQRFKELHSQADSFKIQLNTHLSEIMMKSKGYTLDNIQRFISNFFNRANSEGGLTAKDAIPVYNIATMCFYLQRYEHCAGLIDRFSKGDLSSLPGGLEIQVLLCLLLAQALIMNAEPEKALSALSHLEGLLSKVDPNGDTSLNVDKFWNRFYILKTNAFLITKNMKNCKQDIRHLTKSSGQNYGVPTNFVKSNYEYLRKNYSKSVRMLQIQQYRPHHETGECIPVMYYNNLGCIHYQWKKHGLGVHYFSKALQEFEKLQSRAKKNSVQLLNLSASRQYELQYNIGMQLLAADSPEKAFEYFFNAVHVYYTNPKLWYRLAECCIAAHKRAQESDIKLLSVGQGLQAKLVVETPVRENLAQDIQSAAFPAATLGFGALCIENVLTLLSKFEANRSSGRPLKTVMKPRDVEYLRAQALASGAYINLGLGNFLKARNLCSTALSLTLPGALRYVVTMYLAEALLNLGSTDDAFSALSTSAISENLSISTDSSEAEKSADRNESPAPGQASGQNSEDPKNLKPSYPESQNIASAYIHHNLACIHAMKNDTENTRASLHKVNAGFTSIGNNLPTESIMLSACLEKQRGNQALAAEILQRRQIPNYQPYAQEI